MSDLTRKRIEELARRFRGFHVVLPKIIETQEEADEVTSRDVTGKKWEVGEKYYNAIIGNHEPYAEGLKRIRKEIDGNKRD